MPTKNCIISAVGKNSLHREWIKGSSKDFDLHIIVYDESYETYRNDTPFVEAGTGYKLRLVHDYLMRHEDLLEVYDYFFLPDDDISTCSSDINSLFHLMRRYGLELVQPSLIDSYFTYKHTLFDGRYKIRHTDFVEMMAPCFSCDALKKVLFTFAEGTRGWGCEYHWSKLINTTGREMAIIDEVRMRHVRPVSSYSSESKEEMDAYMDKHGLSYKVPTIHDVIFNEAKPSSGSSKQAVLLVTHYYDEQLVLQKYERLRHELRTDKYDVFLVINTHDKSIEHKLRDKANVCAYNLDDINALGYEPMGCTLYPGNCHFTWLAFYASHRRYTHYWIVEYDVCFTSPWNELMNSFAECDCDLIASRVERYDNNINGNWAWWRLNNNSGFPLEQSVKVFHPICRFSQRALRYLNEFLKRGFTAHSELIIPTCLYNAGYTITDFGRSRDSLFRNALKDFYETLPDGSSTMRYRQVFSSSDIKYHEHPRTLFHPVKY